MKIYNDSWYKAIKKRRSRRKYINKDIEEKKLNKLKGFIKKINEISQVTRSVIIKGDCNELFTGIIGPYGSIKGASTFVVFIGDKRDDYIDQKIGYYGEQIILEATVNGLGTCWVAGTFKPEKISKEINLKEHEEIMAISPVGYTRDKNSLGEKMISLLVSSHKRKEINKICKGGFNQEWPDWVKSSLKCARLAPSAVNRQPWIFTVNNNSIKISVTPEKKHENVSRLIDCGIAMAHLEIGAKHEGIKGKWEDLKFPDVAKFTKINGAVKK